MESMSDGKEGEGFDQVLGGLRSVVERLEGGNLSLEQSLQAFEEGVRLSRRGAEILDAAEHRIELLLREPGGDVKTVPFETEPRGGR
jgi:exodeoxyribonuclease VII small subunit